MADKRLTELSTPSGGPAAGDLLYLVDVSDVADSAQGSSRKATVGSLPLGQATGLVLWVDSVNGSDATGTRGNAALPFLTLTAAKNAAQAGDTIQVRPGTYNEADLLKNGVNWRGEPGADIVYTNPAGGRIFSDNTATVVCSVVWPGKIRNQVADLSPGNSAAIVVAGAGSVVQMVLGDVSAVADSTYAVYHGGGTLVLSAASVTASGASGMALWWGGGVIGRYDIGYLLATGAAGHAVHSDAGDGSPAYLRAHKVEASGSGGVGIYYRPTNTESKLWVETDEVIGPADGTGVDARRGKLYVTASKISGGQPLVLRTLSGGVPSQVWVTAQKVTVSAGGTGCIAVTGPQSLLCEVDLRHVEDLGAAGPLFDVQGGSNARVNVGDLRLAAGTAVGVSLTSGVVEGRVDGTLATAGNPVSLADSLGTLRNVTLLAASGRDALTASSSRTVTVEGCLAVNSTVGASVTLAGGPLVRSDTGAVRVGGGLTVPGAGTNSERFGSGAVAAGVRGTAVGYNASAAGQDAAALGANCSAAQIGAVSFGANITNNGQSGVALGNQVTVAGDYGVSIGGASAAGANQVAIGRGATANSGTLYSRVAIGFESACTADNQFVCGANASVHRNITDVYFGAGVTAGSPVAYTIHGTGGTGADNAGSDLSLAGGIATGSAAGGSVKLKSSTPGGSGSSPQSLATVLEVATGSKIAFFAGTPNAKQTVSGKLASAASVADLVATLQSLMTALATKYALVTDGTT